MDYGSIIKRAWRITWRYKILWLFGLLAGSSYSGNPSSSSSYSSGDYGSVPPEAREVFERAGWWLQDNIGLIVAIVIGLMLIGIIFWVVSIAARGGLIHLVNEAEENRRVRAGAGWSAGFGRWVPMFAIRFLLFFPFALLIVLFLAVSVGPVIIASIAGDEALVPAVFGMCGAIAVVAILGIVVGSALELIAQLAERYAVLDSMGTIASIKAGWEALRTRFKNVLLVWLIMFGIGIGFSLAMALLLVIFGVGAVVAVLAAGPLGAIMVVLMAIAVAMLPTAIYSTFVSAVWTVFWRDLTGRSAIPVRNAPTPVSPVESQSVPQQIPAPPAPPAPGV